MVNIAMARVVVGFVERTGTPYRHEDEAAMGAAGQPVLWQWLQGQAARLRIALSGGMTARHAELGPRA